MNWITLCGIILLSLLSKTLPTKDINDVFNNTLDLSSSERRLNTPDNVFKIKAPGWEERTEWPDDYPRPPKTAQSLFFIQRNLNTNTIVYDIDLDEGKMKSNHPIDAYWLRYGEDDRRKDLSWLESILAYGYSSKKIELGYRIKLKAYNDRYIQLAQIDGTWKALMAINKKDCYLQNIYVYADESGIFPDVKYVDIYGLHPVTGALEVERILNE